MRENKYDDPVFFEKYGQMLRSIKGLAGAGEWETLQKMLPDFSGKAVLDLGCGYGWHCKYASEQGAASVVGVDLSQKMLQTARERNTAPNITYLCQAIEEVDFPKESFDIVISSLALHYVASFEETARRVYALLKPGGTFVFSAEHPVFTAYGSQDWVYDEEGNILYFPVDRYFAEGEREACFLGERVKKYHRTLTAYLDGLLAQGFMITGVREPMPPQELLNTVEGMKDELRRPMMLIVSAEKAEKNGKKEST